MGQIVVVKAFQGTVEAVELHQKESSAWASLRDYVGAPQDTTLRDWWHAWSTLNPPDWYNHNDYGDCRLLRPRDCAAGANGALVFEQGCTGECGA